MTRTCQVLVEGGYDGLLKAGVHYVPVRRDLANLADALLIVRDPSAVDRITRRAFEDLFLAGKLTYASAAAKLDEAMAGAPVRPRRGNILPLSSRFPPGQSALTTHSPTSAKQISARGQ